MIKELGLVELPEDPLLDITIRIQVPEDGTVSLAQIMTGSRMEIATYLLNYDIGTLFMLTILTILGLMLLIVIVVFKCYRMEESRWVILMYLHQLVICWAFFDSSLHVFLPLSSELCAYLSYYALMLMPIPLLVFTEKSLKLKNHFFGLMIALILINITIQTILSILGIVSLDKMLLLTHASVFASIIGGLLSALNYSRRVRFIGIERMKESRLFLFAYLDMLVFAIIDLLIFLQGKSNVYRTVLLVGICSFFLILLIYTMTTFLEQNKKAEKEAAEGRAYLQLAMTDSLTGLGNRRACEKKMRTISETLGPNENAVLFMIDIDGLKNTNDKFGHATGDDLILSAGKAIRLATRALKGSCFRIGGDEFTVVVSGNDISLDEFHRVLIEETERHNSLSLIPLSFSLGYAYLIDPFGKRLSLDEWKQEADIQMYIDKNKHSGGRRKEMELDLQEILNSVAVTEDARDKYTADHSARVRAISGMIGRFLGLSANTLEELDLAAHLHDIGKIAVPDNVLLKPGKLTEEELSIVRSHPCIGYDILSRSNSMSEVAVIVRHHHERFDGKGYPDGLSKEEIPFSARIIAIADSIDAMTSKRVYRDAMSFEQCRIEIENNLGTMYDPTIGKITLDHWDEMVDNLNHIQKTGQ
ncbi:MAG: diguanylate cyclase [Lachnospiraceae bacterium]|nr:diguanylate cyclase [Lachnospiraceae bacterium]